MTRPTTVLATTLFTLCAASALLLSPNAQATTAAAAFPHLRLVRSFPAKDSTLMTSPDGIRLWLSEVTEPRISKISLATASGVPVSIGALTRDAATGAPLVAMLSKSIPEGAYRVTWKAMSKDGHVVNGTFGFRVGASK